MHARVVAATAATILGTGLSLLSPGSGARAGEVGEAAEPGGPTVIAHRGAAAYGPVVADPATRNALGMRALGTAASRVANVLAYNDVFMLIAAIALLTMVWMLIHRLRLLKRDRALARAASSPAPLPTPAP